MRLRRASDLQPSTLYSRKELREQGMHPRVLASEQLTTPILGYCTRADRPATLLQIARVLQRSVVPGAVISHVTAAEILGFPLPRKHTRAGGALLHCTVEAGGPRRAGRTVVVHTVATLERKRYRGLDLPSVLDVLLQIAPLLAHAELVACIDAVVARGHGAAVHLELARLLREVAALRGPGATALRKTARDAREDVWSPMETRTRLLVVARGFPEPTPNLRVQEPSTGKTFVIDLAFPAQRVAVEYDSEEHRLNREQWQKDLHKNEVLHQLGWAVLRISIADVRRPEAFLTLLGKTVPRDVP